VEQPIFFDVGANEGKFSMELHSAFPQSAIYAFEPHPRTHARAQERLGSKATVFHCGLGDCCKKMILYDVAGAEGTSHASLYADVVASTDKQVASVDVDVRTVDDVAESEKISHIDFLKIDTEGNEYPVLVGAINLLKKKAVGIIHFEFNEMNIISGHSLCNFKILLKDYRLYRLLPHGLLELDDMPILTELYGYQNIIAIRSELVTW
jgi:FkbM family methyltransferase